MDFFALTEKRPLTARPLWLAADIERRAAAEPDADKKAALDAVAAAFRGIAERRAADPAFSVECRKVGARDSGPPDLFLYGTIDAEESAAAFDARDRARKKLAASGENISEQAVSEATGRDPRWVRDIGEVRKRWLLAGVVGGEVEVARIFAIGCQDGGLPGGVSLLMDAVEEVKAFNCADAEKKSG